MEIEQIQRRYVLITWSVSPTLRRPPRFSFLSDVVSLQMCIDFAPFYCLCLCQIYLFSLILYCKNKQMRSVLELYFFKRKTEFNNTRELS